VWMKGKNWIVDCLKLRDFSNCGGVIYRNMFPLGARKEWLWLLLNWEWLQYDFVRYCRYSSKFPTLILQRKDWITQWCFQKTLFKEWREKNILNWAAAGVLWFMLLPLSEGVFWKYFLWRDLSQNKNLNVSIDCRVRGVSKEINLG